jgi:hypothetical protein
MEKKEYTSPEIYAILFSESVIRTSVGDDEYSDTNWDDENMKPITGF